MARVGTPTLLTFQSDENCRFKSCPDHRDREQTAAREDAAPAEVTQENMLCEKMGWWQAVKMVSTAVGRTGLQEVRKKSDK